MKIKSAWHSSSANANAKISERGTVCLRPRSGTATARPTIHSPSRSCSATIADPQRRRRGSE
eukprot:5200694-Pyramimonas_sp.AAC.1